MSSQSCTQIINFINFFGNFDGFEAIKNLVYWKCESSVQDYTYRVPVQILKYILELLQTLVPYLDKEFIKSCILKIYRVRT